MNAKLTNTTDCRAKDPVDLEQLVRRCMGRIELAERLLKSFETRFPDDLSKIEDCLAQDDATGMSRLVHQLKGAAANISAPELYAILARMELAVRGQQSEVAHDCLEEVHQAWDRFQQFTSLAGQR
jgi:HPt (histidine-containing phosphotransfer) domain-containing protein